MSITLQDIEDDDWLRGYTQMLFTAESHEEVFLSVKHLLAVQSGALQRLAELAEDGLQWRRIRELANDNQRIMVEMIEKHEAARAPSVKEGKS
jgi:hypothetical protein